MLSHGDSFCTLDVDYQRMKKILQNPFLMFILSKTPLSWRYKLKEFLERKSEVKFNSKPEEIYNVVDNTIISLALKKQANIVVHGHTHKPGYYPIIHNNINIKRYEIPDWVDRTPGGYIIVEDEQISVISYT
jgi:UDP-2,3-diacylglucosamine hydrolase